MPDIRLDTFRTFVQNASSNSGAIRENRKDNNALVEYGQKGFFKIFTKAFWTSAATNKENFKIRMDFLQALQNEAKLDQASLAEIQQELGITIDEEYNERKNYADLNSTQIKDILASVDNDFITHEDFAQNLIKNFRVNNNEEAKTAIRQYLGITNEEGNDNAQLMSPSVQKTFKNDITALLVNPNITSYNIRMEQIDKFKRRGLPLNPNQHDFINGEILRVYEGRIGKLDNINKIINMELLLDEADELLAEQHQGLSLKERLCQELMQELGEELFNKIPKEEINWIIQAFIRNFKTNVMSHSPKIGNALNALCNDYGVIQKKGKSPLPRTDEKFKSFLNTYKEGIIEAIESLIKTSGEKNKHRQVNEFKFFSEKNMIRSFKVIYQQSDDKDNFAFSPVTRMNFLNSILVHNASLSSVGVKVIDKNSNKCDSFWELWFSKQGTVSNNDFLNGINTLKQNLELIDLEYLQAFSESTIDKHQKKHDVYFKEMEKEVKKDGIEYSEAEFKTKVEEKTQAKIESESDHEIAEEEWKLSSFNLLFLDSSYVNYNEKVNKENVEVKWDYNKANSMRDKLITIYNELKNMEIEDKVNVGTETAALYFLRNLASGMGIQLDNEKGVSNDSEKTDQNTPVSKLTVDFVSLFGKTVLQAKKELPLSEKELNLQERQKFLDNILVDYCHEPEMQLYAENLCMLDKNHEMTFIGIVRMTSDEKVFILENIKQKGQALFEQEKKQYKLVSPQEDDVRLDKMSKYERQIYTSLYNDLADGKFNREDMEYASSLLNKE